MADLLVVGSLRFYLSRLAHFYLPRIYKLSSASLGTYRSLLLVDYTMLRMMFYRIYSSCSNLVFCFYMLSFSFMIDFTILSRCFYYRTSF